MKKAFFNKVDGEIKEVVYDDGKPVVPPVKTDPRWVHKPESKLSEWDTNHWLTRHFAIGFVIHGVQRADPSNGYPVGFWLLRDLAGATYSLFSNGDLLSNDSGKKIAHVHLEAYNLHAKDLE